MNTLRLAPAFLLTFAGGLHTHAPAQTKPDTNTALPSTVKATVPRGATSLLWQRLPVGPQATMMLVHVWAVPRANTPDTLNSYDRYSDSPFCVDVFAPRLDAKKHWGWHRVSSAAYLDSNPPIRLLSHWLVPAKRQGAVLEIISGNGAPGVSTKHTVLVWSQGFQPGTPSPSPQSFGSGGSGGGLISLRFDGVDKRGTMTITATDSFAGRVNSTTTYHFDGERFTSTPKSK